MIKPFQSLQFTANEDDVRRAALLNGLVGNLRTTLSALIEAMGEGIPDPSSTVVTEVAFGQAPAAGAADTFARGDHTHGSPPFDIPDGFVDETMVDDTIATTSDIRKLCEMTQEMRFLLHDLVRIEMGQAPETGMVG